MDSLLIIFINAMIINNYVLIQFLGICPFIGVSRRTGSALGMGAAVTFVMVLAAVFTWIIYWLILERFSITYLKIVAFIFVIASLVQLVELFIRRFFPVLYQNLGIYLALITTNCAVLGSAFLSINKGFPLSAAIINGIGAGAGFTLALLLMSAIRERLELGDVPKPLRGVPIALITAAILSIAFLGFKTLIN